MNGSGYAQTAFDILVLAILALHNTAIHSHGKPPSWLAFRMAALHRRHRLMVTWLRWNVLRRCPECGLRRSWPEIHKMDCGER